MLLASLGSLNWGLPNMRRGSKQGALGDHRWRLVLIAAVAMMALVALAFLNILCSSPGSGAAIGSGGPGTETSFRLSSKELSQGRRQEIEQIGGDQALCRPAGIFEPELGRPAVRPGTDLSSLVDILPAREKSPDHTREYVAGPGGGERDVSRRVDRGLFALDDQRVRALEEHATAVLFGRLPRGAEPMGGDLLRPRAQQMPELSGVRCDHGRGVSL